ncbi:MAG: hypothetical protein ACT4QB_21400 [Gammaproteobacteria bacterium]
MKATARVGKLEAERQEYDQEIAELARVRREVVRIETDRDLEKAQQALIEAQHQATMIEGLRQQDKAASQTVALARAQLENLSDRWMRRQALIEAVSNQERAVEATQTALASLEAQTQDVVGRDEAATAVLAIATEDRSAAEERVTISRTRARMEALDKEIAEIDQRLAKVNELVAQRAAAQQCLRGIKIDRTPYERLQGLEGAVREARVTLGAVATRVRFMPSGSQTIRKGDQEVLAEETMQVTEATRCWKVSARSMSSPVLRISQTADCDSRRPRKRSQRRLPQRRSQISMRQRPSLPSAPKPKPSLTKRSG